MALPTKNGQSESAHRGGQSSLIFVAGDKRAYFRRTALNCKMWFYNWLSEDKRERCPWENLKRETQGKRWTSKSIFISNEFCRKVIFYCRRLFFVVNQLMTSIPKGEREILKPWPFCGSFSKIRCDFLICKIAEFCFFQAFPVSISCVGETAEWDSLKPIIKLIKGIF